MKKTLQLILLIACCIAVVPNTLAQSKKQKELEQRRETLRKEMDLLISLRKSNKKKEISALNEVQDLDQQIKLRKDLIKVTNRQANLLTREITENDNTIRNLRAELSILKEDYAAMIRKSYKSKSEQSKVMFLLSSDNFEQAYKRVQYMKQYANFRKKQSERIEQRTKELQIITKDLVRQKKDKEALIAQNRKAKTLLDKEKAQQDDLVRIIRKKSSSYAAQINKKQTEANRIDRQIDKLIADAIAASNTTSGTKVVKGSSETFALTPEAKVLAADFASNKGRLIWPVERGRIIKRFGKSQHPTLPNITTYSSGIEIETAPNSSARAVFNGEVMSIFKIPGANTVVSIRHGSYITVYRNLINITVRKGDRVKRNQKIGIIAASNITGKTVVKFSVYKNKTKLNPANWVLNK